MDTSESDRLKDRIGPPPEILTKILSIGNVFDEKVVEKVTRLYIPLHKKVVPEGIKITKDLEYGPDERHRLDVHEPLFPPGKPMPIIAFFHGGGFVGGDKNSVGDLIYGNVPNYFARHGMLGINGTYRLAPKYKWPKGAEDVAGVVKWIKEQGVKYGGDPENIFLFGHSAGAAHVATYLCHKELKPENGAGVSGAILMSGQYKLDPANPRRFDKAYYGSNTERYAEMSAINNLEGLDVPSFVIFAEYDPHQIEMQSVSLFEALCRKDNHCPRMTRIKNHNHISEAVHINTSDESIGPEILDFIKTGR